MRETGSEIVIHSSPPRPEIDEVADKGGSDDDEDVKEAVPEEVIITVNVSDWDPDKTDTADEMTEDPAVSKINISKHEYVLTSFTVLCLLCNGGDWGK